MELSYAGLCSYRDGLGRLCRCDLYVYREGDAAVVVASEREDNPGASITNGRGRHHGHDSKRPMRNGLSKQLEERSGKIYDAMTLSCDSVMRS